METYEVRNHIQESNKDWYLRSFISVDLCREFHGMLQ